MNDTRNKAVSLVLERLQGNPAEPSDCPAKQPLKVSVRSPSRDTRRLSDTPEIYIPARPSAVSFCVDSPSGRKSIERPRYSTGHLEVRTPNRGKIDRPSVRRSTGRAQSSYAQTLRPAPLTASPSSGRHSVEGVSCSTHSTAKISFLGSRPPSILIHPSPGENPLLPFAPGQLCREESSISGELMVTRQSLILASSSGSSERENSWGNLQSRLTVLPEPRNMRLFSSAPQGTLHVTPILSNLSTVRHLQSIVVSKEMEPPGPPGQTAGGAVRSSEEAVIAKTSKFRKQCRVRSNTTSVSRASVPNRSSSLASSLVRAVLKQRAKRRSASSSGCSWSSEDYGRARRRISGSTRENIASRRSNRRLVAGYASNRSGATRRSHNGRVRLARKRRS